MIFDDYYLFLFSNLRNIEAIVGLDYLFSKSDTNALYLRGSLKVYFVLCFVCISFLQITYFIKLFILFLFTHNVLGLMSLWITQILKSCARSLTKYERMAGQILSTRNESWNIVCEIRNKQDKEKKANKQEISKLWKI